MSKDTHSIEEVREDMLAQYMKREPTPGNCMIKDQLLAMINYAEKTDIYYKIDPAKTMSTGIDDIIHATVNALINYIYRINSVCTNCHPNAAIMLTKYMQKKFEEELMGQSLDIALMQRKECDGKQKRQSNNQAANTSDQSGEAVQSSQDTK